MCSFSTAKEKLVVCTNKLSEINQTVGDSISFKGPLVGQVMKCQTGHNMKISPDGHTPPT